MSDEKRFKNIKSNNNEYNSEGPKNCSQQSGSSRKSGNETFIKENSSNSSSITTNNTINGNNNNKQFRSIIPRFIQSEQKYQQDRRKFLLNNDDLNNQQQNKESKQSPKEKILKHQQQQQRSFSQESIGNNSNKINNSDPYIQRKTPDSSKTSNIIVINENRSDTANYKTVSLLTSSVNEEDTLFIDNITSIQNSLEQWIESQNQNLDDGLYDKSSINFGPKVSNENIPGTPMEPIQQENQELKTPPTIINYLSNPDTIFDIINTNTIMQNEKPERRKSLDILMMKPASMSMHPTNHQTPSMPTSKTNSPIDGTHVINMDKDNKSNNNSIDNDNNDSNSQPIINNDNLPMTIIKSTNTNNNNNNSNSLGNFNNWKHRPSLQTSSIGDGGYGMQKMSSIDSIQMKGDQRRSSKQDIEGLDPESLMFRDGRRRIDMVLSYEEENEGVMTEAEAKRREQRKIFQDSLIKEGLEFELEDCSQAYDEKTFFLKIHLPWRTETRYAEVMNLKLPVKRFITITVKAWDDDKGNVLKLNTWRKWLQKFRKLSELDRTLIEDEPSFYSATAGGNPEEQFIVKDRCTSYNSAQRSLIVMQILLRAKFDDSEKSGIRRLLNDSTYLAYFPLHEGRYDRAHSSGAIFDRRVLYLEWSRPARWYKKQPIGLIRKYFGDKIGLYFCWLGFYTNMLIYPAVVGTICFFYGLISMNSDDNKPSQEICDGYGVGNITLCPLCDKACSYQKLSDSCLFAKMSYLFDNPSTVFFAIFMSFWATTFLELWKRKQSLILWEWDLQDIENEEENRPEFEATVKTFRTNPVTKEREPYMPTWSRALRYIATGSAVLFMICIVLGAVLGTIIYRISVVAVIYGGGNGFVRTHAKIFTTITAATINLIIIMILTRIYHKLAIRLTNMENPRTHTEYEDSYTFKIFFFEFMNFYSSLIYIAFFKGRFYDYPGDDVVRQSEFFKLKGDICDPAGCLSELCIQLAIIMVGKQCWNNYMEYLYPKFWNWWRQRKHKKETKDETHLHMAWEQDYHLQDPGRLALFDEYLEMVIQYGFVTLFVAAFPLAPLFALLNNVAEIRLDAFKMVTQARRPLAERAEDIGAWFGILKIITYTAVVSNAFVIAYTSDYIPRMVFKYVYSPNNTLTGYIDHSLSEFNTSHYKQEWGATSAETDPDVCQYRGYRNGPNDSDPYGLSPHYWHVFAARLAFVVVFEHVVFVLTGIMQFIIPDIPAEVKTQIQREQLLAKEAKYQHGLKKAQDNDYNELLQALKEQGNTNVNTNPNNSGGGGGGTGSGTGNTNLLMRQGPRGSWGRRLSRISDGLDAHVEITTRPRRSMESTVWEVT